MARLIYAGQALANLERLTDFLLETDPVAAEHTLALIAEAVGILANHRLIGLNARPATSELALPRQGACTAR